MVELNSLERAALREIFEVYEREGAVTEYVRGRALGDRDFEEACASLADKGLIRANPAGSFTGRRYSELTLSGRAWLRDFEEFKREQRDRAWSDRRFQIALSVITMLLSVLAGVVAGFLVSIGVPFVK